MFIFKWLYLKYILYIWYVDLITPDRNKLL